jgi:hypothetical protein
MLYPIATSAAAFGAADIQHVELADQISEYDCVIAGHCLARWPQQELSFTSNVDISQLQRGRSMRTILLGLLAGASIAIATPVVPASAQVIVDTPVGGVRVGRDRDYDRYRYSDYDRPRYRSYARDCRTITIRRDDGSVRRIRRCD